MSVALQKPWSVEQFMSWVARQDSRHEFDGARPVAMTGGTMRHNRIMTNIHAALRARLRGTGCSFFGPDVGVRSGEKIRFPDALVTCTKTSDSSTLAPDPVIVFEVLSADSGQRDRIEKVREYAAVPSIRRYVIVETSSPGLLVLHRGGGGEPWAAHAVEADETLALPEIGADIPVSEIYEDVDFAEPAPDAPEA